MNKSARLSKLMLYLTDKKTFNLKDIINEFNISRSTALRDIASLEEIGYPIYSTSGKYGGYGILHNKIKHHLEFTNEEVFAIYFAIETLNSYQSTPFHIDAQNLINKYRLILPEYLQDTLLEMGKVLKLEMTPHKYTSPLLKDLLLSAVDKHVVEIGYSDKSYIIQIVNITARFGQWYITALERNTDRVRVFRCDRITKFEIVDNVSYLDSSLVETLVENANFKERNHHFRVEIDIKSVDHFYKESYPTMELTINDNKAYINGRYAKEETSFITRYVASYGSALISVEPLSFKERLIEYSLSVYNHFSKL